MTLAVPLILLVSVIQVADFYECYWGVNDNNGIPLWKRDCHGSHCIKIVDESGLATHNCDLTSFCEKTGCASNHLGGHTCCCDSQLCNSSPIHSLFPIVFVMYAFFCLLNR